MLNPRRFSVLPAAFWLACASPPSDDEDGGDSAGGKGDELNGKGICAGRLEDKRDGKSGEVGISELGDVFARLVLRADGDPTDCPMSYGEVMAKLRETDKEGECGNGGRAGIRTAVVSETAQVMGKPDRYRAVPIRQCGNRGPHELLFSLFGISATTSKLPDSVEVISFDATKKLFNYYAIEGGELGFFGSSEEYMVGEGGRCKNCHPAGGLNMKELEAPWVHWEGDTTTPGAAELVDRFDDLGTRTNGIDLESVVDFGNQAITTPRVNRMLATNDVKQLLRPLFCTVQINIATATSSGNSPPDAIPSHPFVGNLGFDRLPITAEQYRNAIKAAGQRVVGPNGTTQLVDQNGQGVTDTFFAFPIVKTSTEDIFYITQLQQMGIIDQEFAVDVQAVDMTRPVFSDARCGLLDLAPKIKLTKSTGEPVEGLAQTIREGFVESLAGQPEGSPAAQFAANLAAEGNMQTHLDAATAFLTACKARPPEEFLADAFQVVSLQRNLARKLDVMEFPSTMPIDDLKVDPGTFFDPKTCTLTK